MGSVSYIEWYAFYSCPALVTLSIEGNGLTQIDGGAFDGCKAIESLTLGTGIMHIGKAFGSSKLLTEVTYNGTIEQWNATAKSSNWFDGTSISVVHCSNGDVDIA
jgi:hypothetical protein